MKSKKNVFIMSISLLMSACSSFRDNQISQSDVSINGGKIGASSWSESLALKRASWFQGAHLMADWYWGILPKSSAFNAWLSAEEKAQVSNCAQVLISLLFIADESKISRDYFFKPLSEQGQLIHLPRFKDALSLHPMSGEEMWGSYKFQAVCLKSTELQMSIVLPSFDALDLR